MKTVSEKTMDKKGIQAMYGARLVEKKCWAKFVGIMVLEPRELGGKIPQKLVFEVDRSHPRNKAFLSALRAIREQVAATGTKVRPPASLSQ